MSIRTRFAPSPTGYLHVGGARTALFNYLMAKKGEGQFILRIEDTDRKRSDEASVRAILEGMEWLDLAYDEGPFYQSDRRQRYQQALDKLLNSDQAYRCYCTQDELDAMREEQRKHGGKPRYDGRCRDRKGPPPPGADPVVRFKRPETGSTVVEDLVRGDVAYDNAELDDLVLARSDGTPTYNFTVVVDDMDMHITHVVRGDDHLNNTPRQMHIYDALGGTPPRFAHVPMILGEDGSRLSKRHGAVSVLSYRDEGYLPQALLNYLVRLGWSHGDEEIFSLEEMVAKFSIDDVNRAASTFNEDKLRWLNQHYLKTLPAREVALHLREHFDRRGIDAMDMPSLAMVVKAFAERCHTLVEMAEKAEVYFKPLGDYDPKAAKKALRPVAENPLQATRDALAQIDEDNWEPETLEAAIRQVAEDLDVGLGKIGMPLRVALTGNTVSPGIGETIALTGKEQCLQRLNRALEYVRERADRG